MYILVSEGTNQKGLKMYYINKTQDATRKSIEKRMINAVIKNRNTDLLVAEAEAMYKNSLINDSDFNFLTDIETIKMIYA